MAQVHDKAIAGKTDGNPTPQVQVCVGGCTRGPHCDTLSLEEWDAINYKCIVREYEGQ